MEWQQNETRHQRRVNEVVNGLVCSFDETTVVPHLEALEFRRIVGPLRLL